MDNVFSWLQNYIIFTKQPSVMGTICRFMNYFAGVAFYMITKHITIVMVGPRRVMYIIIVALQRVNGGAVVVGCDKTYHQNLYSFDSYLGFV
jgi:hypothetical protein